MILFIFNFEGFAMKKFLINLMKLFSICLLTLALQVFVGLLIGSQYQEGYDAALIDKVARLKSISSPKIILTGNSNLAFGINSPMMEQALNMPVVNLGLHGGLGNAFYERTAALNINHGDIVIVCHSNFADDGRIGDIALAWITVEYHKELWNIISEKDYFDMLTGWPNYWFRSFTCWLTLQGNKTPNPPYSRKAFNEYGDIVKRPESAGHPIDKMFKPQEVKVPAINDTCVNRLNEFNKYVKEKGATLLIAAYPIGAGKYTPPVEEYDKFQKELADRLDCEIISDYRDYFIPYEYFYNASLHLNELGAEMRTSQLIKDINRSGF